MNIELDFTYTKMANYDSDLTSQTPVVHYPGIIRDMLRKYANLQERYTLPMLSMYAIEACLGRLL